MSNFRIGEKIVFIGAKHDKDPMCLLPKINEIVTVSGFSEVNKGSLYIREYPVATTGVVQSITDCCFRKLDWQFGHDICAELSRQYNEDFVEL